jgi:hypothetical protein
MEYVVGPILALLIGMKFTHYKNEKCAAATADKITKLENTIIDNNKLMSQQTLKLLTPVAKNIQSINKQLGL